MKKTVVICLATLLLAACSTRLSVVKRQYNKGYYVSLIKKHNEVTVHDRNVTTKHTPSPKNDVISEQIVMAQPMPSQLAAPPAAKPAKIPADSSPAARKLMASAQTTPIPEISTPVIKPVKTPANTGNSGGSVASLILMLLIAGIPFFNLIPVFIHDGSITTNFWITLILDFFLVPGIVFAMLVVLDVVDRK